MNPYENAAILFAIDVFVQDERNVQHLVADRILRRIQRLHTQIHRLTTICTQCREYDQQFYVQRLISSRQHSKHDLLTQKAKKVCYNNGHRRNEFESYLNQHDMQLGIVISATQTKFNKQTNTQTHEHHSFPLSLNTTTTRSPVQFVIATFVGVEQRSGRIGRHWRWRRRLSRRVKR